MSSFETDFFSDIDMQCPGDWYGGFKEGRVMRFGNAERALSDLFTGEWQGSTFDLTLSDFDRRLRDQLGSATDRYWVEPWTIRMTTRANRAVLGTPYTVFVGPVIGLAKQQHLTLDVTLGDIVSQTLLSDEHQVPWRLIRDSWIVQAELDGTFIISEQLDLDGPEPIIYGEHRRIPGVDPASPQGFQYTPIYLGRETFSGGDVYVWMVCGHACADIPEVLVWTPDEEGGLGTYVSVLADGDWQIPHTSAPAYEDQRSSTFENDRRYTLIRAVVGNADADAVVTGEKTLTCFVDGVEPVGDGTGSVIQDRIQQYEHFLINFVAHHGQDSYQSGAWLDNPTWDISDRSVEIVDEASFSRCSAIAEDRLPIAAGSPVQDYPAGYIGAAIIGAGASDRNTVKRWIAEWNRSCAVRFGITHLGQIRVTMLHPTEAIKAAAPLYTDAYEILKDSFGIDFGWEKKANRIPWRADFEFTSGQWMTSGLAVDDEATINYGGEIIGDIRDYPFAPGVAMANNLAQLERLIRRHPVRHIRLDATVGHDYLGDSLGYRDVGDYIRYSHFDAVGELREIRLAQVVRCGVKVGERKCWVEALDCEDLIGYDEPAPTGIGGGEDFPPAEGSPINDRCDSATLIPTGSPSDIIDYLAEINTSLNTEDPSVTGLCGDPAGAFHAAWFEYTPAENQRGFVGTQGSDYDTILSVWSGTCGALTLEACNDNIPPLQTSFYEWVAPDALLAGVTYYFLVTGFTDGDFGNLRFRLFLETAV